MINQCIQEHGIEHATAKEVEDHQMMPLHIICANPHTHFTGEAISIRAHLQLAPEEVEQQDSEGMTPFQYLCRSDIDIDFLEEDRSFFSLMAWWYTCMGGDSPDPNGQEAKAG